MPELFRLHYVLYLVVVLVVVEYVCVCGCVLRPQKVRHLLAPTGKIRASFHHQG